MQEKTGFKELDEVVKCGKAGVGQVIIIMDAFGRRVSDQYIQAAAFSIKIPE